MIVCDKCNRAISPLTGLKTERFPACYEAARNVCSEDYNHSFCYELMDKPGSGDEDDDYRIWMKIREWLDRHCWGSSTVV